MQTKALMQGIPSELRNCIAHIGQVGFFDVFFKLLNESLEIDQCMVYHYSDTAPRCLLSRNFGSVSKGNSMAQKYLESGYLVDPLCDVLATTKRGQDLVFWSDECRLNMPAAYRATYFDDIGILDKVAMLHHNDVGKFGLNFYRKIGRDRFDTSGQPDKDFWACLSQICLTHLLMISNQNGLGPLAILSEKERQICSGILQGRKFEQIAADIGIAHSTAVTYRRRAYDKLGISSRSALFAICKTG